MPIKKIVYICFIPAAYFSLHLAQNVALMIFWNALVFTVVIGIAVATLAGRSSWKAAIELLFVACVLNVFFFFTTVLVKAINTREANEMVAQLKARSEVDCPILMRELKRRDKYSGRTIVGYRWMILAEGDCEITITLFLFNGRRETFDVGSGDLVHVMYD